MRARAIVAALLLSTAAALSVPRARAQDPARTWIAGDMHAHVCPPDTTREVSISPEKTVARAKELGMQFIVLTPHVRGEWWKDDAVIARLEKHVETAKELETKLGIVVIPGFEETQHQGHVGVSFADVRGTISKDGRDLSRGQLLSAFARGGAVLTINHPFAKGIQLPGVREAEHDLSWRTWTEARDEDSERIVDACTCVEVVNEGLGFAELIAAVPEGQRTTDKALAKLDQIVLATGRKVAPVGGSDNHGFWLAATTWLCVRAKTRDEVHAALKEGRSCAGGPDASSLRVEAGASAASIGDDLKTSEGKLVARFDGKAEIWLDGRPLGERDGGCALEVDPNFRHAIRIAKGPSRSGYVYVNRDRPAPAPRKVFR